MEQLQQQNFMKEQYASVTDDASGVAAGSMEEILLEDDNVGISSLLQSFCYSFVYSCLCLSFELFLLNLLAPTSLPHCQCRAPILAPFQLPLLRFSFVLLPYPPAPKLLQICTCH